jgi:hypothetical protein
MFVQDVEDLEQSYTAGKIVPTHADAAIETPIASNSRESSATVTPMVTPAYSLMITPEHARGWVASLKESTDLANPSLMQLHKLLVSISNWMLIGVLIGFGDAIVANIFSDLLRCTQLDPFSSDWTDAVKTLFDFLT